MFCDKNKCREEECMFWTRMYYPNPDDPNTPLEDWNCSFLWTNVLLSEISAKLSMLSNRENSQQTKED